MRIEQIWGELEEEARSGAASPWLTRLALPTPSQRLLVALETAGLRRSLLLPMPEVAIPSQANWPQCRGLELIRLSLDGTAHFGVRLTDPASSDVFSILAEDIAPRIASSGSAQASAATLIGRLRLWQKFLSAGTAGLTPEGARGLYGELLTLKAVLLPEFGAYRAVHAWRAPNASHQDFQFATGSIEVKTTAAKQPQSVRIASERQLDETGVGALYLHVIILDEREVEVSSATLGDGLPDIVLDLRRLLAPSADVAALFEERLVDAGYFDAHGPRYQSTRLTVRSSQTFTVVHDFPRIIERELRPGVGDVNYGLSLAACQPYLVDIGAMLAALKGGDASQPAP